MTEDGRCTLTIDTTGPEDGLVWEVIYTAATEIEATCVRQGRHGLISELGEWFLAMFIFHA